MGIATTENSGTAEPGASQTYAMGGAASSFLALACVGFIASASPAIAQDTPGGADDVASAGEGRRLGGVTVTDTAIDESYNRTESSSVKFTQPLLDTPRSVTVIPHEVIADRGFMTLTDVLRTTPGVTLGAGEGGTPLGDRPFIRGYEASTDMQVNGIRNVGRVTYEVFNLESAEVVYGPAGAISGRGSTGGSINLVLKSPQAGDFFSASLTGGTDETKRLVVDTNRQIGEDVAIRFSGMFHDADVAGRDEVWTRRYGFMPSITFGLNQPLRVTASYSYLKTDGIGDQGMPFSGSGTNSPVVVDRDFYYGIPARDFARTTSQFVSGLIEYDVSDRITLRNSTRYSRATNEAVFSRPTFSTNETPNAAQAAIGCIPGLPAGLAVDDPNRCVDVHFRSHNRLMTGFINQLDLRGEVETGSITHNFIMGLEYSKEKIQTRPVLQQGTSGLTPLPPTTLSMLFGNPDPNTPYRPLVRQVPDGPLNRSDLKTKAAFISNSITIVPQLIVDLGVRYDEFEPSNASRSAKYDFFNYAAGVIYKPVPNGSIYLNFATSSNPPGECDSMAGGAEGVGACTLTNNNIDSDPERAKSWELGTKWDLFGGAFSLTGALFQTKKTNARATDPNTGGLMNIGSNRVRGVQLGASGNITPQWAVFAGYVYLKTKIIDDGAGDSDGNPFRFQAPHTGNLWTTYQLTPQFDVGVGVNYVDKRYVDTDKTRFMPSYWRFDASAGFDVTENFNLRLNVLNIGNKTYFDASHVGIFAVTAPGRSALLTGNLRF